MLKGERDGVRKGQQREKREAAAMCVGGGLVEPRSSHRHQHRWTEAAHTPPYDHGLRPCGGVWSGPAKTGNAKDKGRGHDDEKEGEEEEGTRRERESESE